jgi:hypothetical protein
MGLLLILTLIVLVYIAYAVSNIKPHGVDLGKIEERLKELENSIGGIDSHISAIAESLESIDSAVSASVRHWLDEYAIKAEASSRPPIVVRPSKSEPAA